MKMISNSIIGFQLKKQPNLSNLCQLIPKVHWRSSESTRKSRAACFSGSGQNSLCGLPLGVVRCKWLEAKEGVPAYELIGKETKITKNKTSRDHSLENKSWHVRWHFEPLNKTFKSILSAGLGKQQRISRFTCRVYERW